MSKAKTGATWRRKDGRWEHKRTIDGRQRAFYGRTASEAEAGPARWASAQARDAQDAHSAALAAADVTVAAFAARWLDVRKATVRTSTARHNASAVHRWIIPVLGGKVLRLLTVDDVRSLHAAALVVSKDSTVRTLHMVLRAMLDAAVMDGLIPVNPAARPKIAPRVAARDKDSTLTVEQARTVLAAVRGKRHEALYWLALTTGMRSGELLALRRADVNIRDHTVTVRGTVTDGPRGGLMIGEPKTAKSRRVVPLTDSCFEVVSRRVDALTPGAMFLSRPAGLLFPADHGGLMSTTSFLMREWYPLLARLHIPRVRMQDLRHTAATLLISDGVDPVTVAAILGHSSPVMTLNRYSHATAQGSARAVASMERRFA